MAKQKITFPIIFMLILLVCVGIGVIYLVGVTKLTTPHAPKKETIVTFSSGPDASFYGQVKIPTDYVAITEPMLANSSDMAPPRLILTKSTMPVDGHTFFQDVITSPMSDCIVIWTTRGFSSTDDWASSVTGFQGTATNKTTIPVGNRSAQMDTRVMKDRSVYEAFLLVSSANGGTSYYIHTCNAHNESDFLQVVTSLHIAS